MYPTDSKKKTSFVSVTPTKVTPDLPGDRRTFQLWCFHGSNSPCSASLVVDSCNKRTDPVPQIGCWLGLVFGLPDGIFWGDFRVEQRG